MVKDRQHTSGISWHRPSITVIDNILLLILKLYGVVAFAALALVPRYFLPAEDAVILFQYSRNLAEHGAITFLAGGPHVEGATDFGWMLLNALAIRCGIPPFWFCAIANVFSLSMLAVLLLRLANKRLSLSRIFAIAGSAALFPQIFAAASGFAVLPDALLLTTMVFFAMRQKVALASISALVFCLFRPDGVVFAIPLLICLILEQEERGKSISVIGALFFVPGLIYFFWRWHYFGEMFPLPFLVKSDTQRWFGLFVVHSIRTSLPFLVFVSIVLALLKFARNAQKPWLALVLIAVPTLFYWTMRLDQNVGSRFFYYLPLSAAIMLAVNWDFLQANRVLVFRTALVSWLFLFAMPLYRELRTFRDEQFNSVKQIAEALGGMPQHGTIITSEAGFLPYFSDWRTYDAWGLNTPEFAHRFFQSSDVKSLGADLIVLHPDRPESCVILPDWEPNYVDRTWPHLTRNLVEGANETQYELWLTSYGSEFYRQRKRWNYGEGDRECWFVRKNSPLYAEMTRILQEHHGIGPAEALALEKVHGQVKR